MTKLISILLRRKGRYLWVGFSWDASKDQPIRSLEISSIGFI